MTVRDLAACLVSLSEDSEGRISLERVNAVLEFIETEIPEANKMKLLREYKRRMGVRIEADRAFVEFAGGLDDGARNKIKAFILSKNPKSVPEFIENENLIAGLKITVGDTVYENSLKMKLEDLAKSLGA
ncbi:MAG: F0F1 ATP synthase subunit delta [Opitutales bacterium]|nr:F0F1 ATP synthase subunit delta [Opitutales bacterium]